MRNKCIDLDRELGADIGKGYLLVFAQEPHPVLAIVTLKSVFSENAYHELKIPEIPIPSSVKMMTRLVANIALTEPQKMISFTVGKPVATDVDSAFYIYVALTDGYIKHIKIDKHYQQSVAASFMRPTGTEYQYGLSIFNKNLIYMQGTVLYKRNTEMLFCEDHLEIKASATAKPTIDTACSIYTFEHNNIIHDFVLLEGDLHHITLANKATAAGIAFLSASESQYKFLDMKGIKRRCNDGTQHHFLLVYNLIGIYLLDAHQPLDIIFQKPLLRTDKVIQDVEFHFTQDVETFLGVLQIIYQDGLVAWYKVDENLSVSLITKVKVTGFENYCYVGQAQCGHALILREKRDGVLRVVQTSLKNLPFAQYLQENFLA